MPNYKKIFEACTLDKIIICLRELEKPQYTKDRTTLNQILRRARRSEKESLLEPDLQYEKLILKEKYLCNKKRNNPNKRIHKSKADKILKKRTKKEQRRFKIEINAWKEKISEWHFQAFECNDLHQKWISFSNLRRERKSLSEFIQQEQSKLLPLNGLPRLKTFDKKFVPKRLTGNTIEYERSLSDNFTDNWEDIYYEVINSA
jgi:capsule polysaccharide export protein KpsC/LpsZ